MKLLVATTRTQGHRGNDFAHCIPDELVRPGDLVCERDRLDPDGGCGRAFAGLNSAKATTTAEVADLPLTFSDLVEAVRSSLEQAGWSTTHAEDIAEALAAAAEDLPVGAVVERRLDVIQPRQGSHP